MPKIFEIDELEPGYVLKPGEAIRRRITTIDGASVPPASGNADVIAGARAICDASRAEYERRVSNAWRGDDATKQVATDAPATAEQSREARDERTRNAWKG